MNRIFADTDVGRKNIAFAIVLFLIFGMALGIPLTVDLFGGTMLTAAEYQTWKVIHAYSVFLAFVNFFFGYCIDRLNLTRQQKEISSWSFLIAGFAGSIGRSVLVLLSISGGFGSYITSFIETLGFVLGTLIFVLGQIQMSSALRLEQPASVVSKQH
jgi:hypothetical protein